MMQPAILHFKGGREAFQHALHNMTWTPSPGAVLPALVDGVVFMPSTGLICKVRLPTGDGSTTIVCPTRDASERNIRAGDLVAIWVDTEDQHSDLADLRAMVVARLQPSYDIRKQAWQVATNTRPTRYRLLTPLNSPIKRIGGLTLAIGLVLTLFWVISAAADNGPYRVVERVVDRWGAAVFGYARYRDDDLATWGAYTAAVGLLFSYLYDQTAGRLVAWVSRGHS